MIYRIPDRGARPASPPRHRRCDPLPQGDDCFDWHVFEHLDALTPEGIGAQTDPFEAIPFLRFDCDALSVFQEWRAGLERQLRSGDTTAAAKSILDRIAKHDLQDGFTARDVHRPRWANLSDKTQVHAGLELLVDFDWLVATQRETGGRPTIVYSVNPRGAK
jgi:hypothetical protein